MTNKIVADDQITDEQLGQLYRRQIDLVRRVRDGALPFTSVMDGLQNLIEGKFPLAITARFNPETFPGLGEGWKLIPKEHDNRCPDIVADPRLIKLLAILRTGEDVIGGEEKLKRLKEAKCIRLTADWFLFFWTNQHLIPEKWKEVWGVYFDGDVLFSTVGRRCVLCLYWSDDWRWGFGRLVSGWHSDDPSAVLENS